MRVAVLVELGSNLPLADIEHSPKTLRSQLALPTFAQLRADYTLTDD